jgi:HEAT repeat protein
LGVIGDPGAGPALVEALEDDQWPVRAMAAKAIGRMRYRAAIPPLCGALRDRQWWVRANAAEALKLMGDEGIDSLRRTLDDEDTYARHQAVLMLEEAGVIDEEVARLADADERRRGSARELMERLIRIGQIGRLRELSERHPDPAIRHELDGLLPTEARGEAMP